MILFMLLWHNTFYFTGKKTRFTVAYGRQCTSQSTELTSPQSVCISRVADNTVVVSVASQSKYKISFYTKHTMHADSFNLLYFQDVKFHTLYSVAFITRPLTSLWKCRSVSDSEVRYQHAIWSKAVYRVPCYAVVNAGGMKYIKWFWEMTTTFLQMF
jgi:hypothetical protein